MPMCPRDFAAVAAFVSSFLCLTIRAEIRFMPTSIPFRTLHDGDAGYEALRGMIETPVSGWLLLIMRSLLPPSALKSESHAFGRFCFRHLHFPPCASTYGGLHFSFCDRWGLLRSATYSGINTPNLVVSAASLDRGEQRALHYTPHYLHCSALKNFSLGRRPK